MAILLNGVVSFLAAFFGAYFGTRRGFLRNVRELRDAISHKESRDPFHEGWLNGTD